MATRQAAATGGRDGTGKTGTGEVRDAVPPRASSFDAVVAARQAEADADARRANPPERFRQLLREIHACFTGPGVQGRVLRIIRETVKQSLAEDRRYPLELGGGGEPSLGEKVTALAAFHNEFAKCEYMALAEPPEWADAVLFPQDKDVNLELPEYRQAARFEMFAAWWDDLQVRPDDSPCVDVLRRWLGEVREAIAPTPAEDGQSKLTEKDTGEVPYQKGRKDYDPAKDIIKDFNGEAVPGGDRGMVIRLNKDNLPVFVHAHAVKHMHNGRRLWVHRGRFGAALRQHGRELAGSDHERIIRELATELRECKTWECAACQHQVRAALRPESCPNCKAPANAMCQKRS